MEAYTSFAAVYDLFMDNVPYDEWCGQLVKILGEHGIHSGIVATATTTTTKTATQHHRKHFSNLQKQPHFFFSLMTYPFKWLKMRI